MKQTPIFVPPVVDSTQSSVNTEAYEQSVDLYEQGKYLPAFHSLLDYLNNTFRTKYGNAEGTEFNIPHGSILVHISVDSDRISVVADFLRLPEKGRVAMLRQVADLNLNQLMLSRFVKEGEQLKMEYVCPLSQSHPHKMFYVLQNICHIGDRYDDEFCTKFGATRCYEPQVVPYPAEEVDRIYEAIQAVGKATLEAVKEYDAMRRYGYSWNVLDMAFYQISYFARPQGQLFNDLEKAVNDMDAELPIAEVVAKGKAFLEKLVATSREKLAEDLYFTDTLVSTRRRSSLKNVQENFQSIYKEATEALQSENYERAVVRLLYAFYEAYFYNDMQDDISRVMAKALKEAAGLPLEKAGEILYDAMDHIMEGDLDDDGLECLDGLFDAKAVEQAQQQMAQAMQAGGEGMAQAMQMQQKMYQAMAGDDMQQLQQRLAEAMMRGDMAEYGKLLAEMQQKMMGL